MAYSAYGSLRSRRTLAHCSALISLLVLVSDLPAVLIVAVTPGVLSVIFRPDSQLDADAPDVAGISSEVATVLSDPVEDWVVSSS